MLPAARSARTLAPRAGRGWGEGASPLGSELRRSESRRGPLTLARGACHRAGHFGPDPLARSDLSPRGGER